MEHDYDKELGKEVRKLDKFVFRIAKWKWIKPSIFVVALLEATISPLLPELVVAAVLSYRKDISWKLLSLISALGSATGAFLLYSAGKYLYRTHEAFFETLLGGNVTTYAGQLFEHHAFVSVFLAAFTPLPDRVFAFLSGVFTLPAFVVASAFFLGRLIRVGIVAYFSYEYGDEAREYILKHTKWVSFIVLALIGVYIVVLASGIL